MIRPLFGVAGLVLGLLVPAVAQAQGHAPVKVAEASAYKPSGIPDRIILTWADDPTTSMAVTWRTDTSVSAALAQIAIASADPGLATKARDVAAKSEVFKSDLSEAKMHSVVFRDLKPKTKYAYRVGDGANWSEWFHFTTASKQPEKFSFVYFGDAQNDIKSMWSRVVREAFKDAPTAAFMIHAGDLVNSAERDAEWGEWHGAGGWLNGMLPSVPTPGNHEYAREPKKTTTDAPKSRLSHHWKPQFTLPTNGPESLQESAYYFDYQGTRIISLNSNEKQEEQIPWLNKVLANNPNKWTVITFHHPIFSTAKGRDNPELRAAWQPIFDKYRVDLVLNGHDHTYGRTGLESTKNATTGDSALSVEAGTVYVVSVSGPKMYELADDVARQMKRVAADTQLYQIITIDGDALRYESRTAVGEVYDAFTLKKRAGKVNELIEQVPNTPRRLRLDRPKAKAKAKAAAAND